MFYFRVIRNRKAQIEQLPHFFSKVKKNCLQRDCTCNLTLLVFKALTAITTCVLHLESSPHSFYPQKHHLSSPLRHFKTTQMHPPSSPPLSQTEQNHKKTLLHQTKPLPLSAKTPALRERESAGKGQTWLGEKGRGQGKREGSITPWEAENEGTQHSTGVGFKPCLCH